MNEHIAEGASGQDNERVLQEEETDAASLPKDNDRSFTRQRQQQRTLDYLFFHAVLQRPPDFHAARRAVQRGANVNAEFEREGIFPIDIASVNNDRQLMKFLVQECDANVNQRAFDGYSALHRAIIMNQVEMVQLLLSIGRANPDLPTSRQGQEPVTPLQLLVTETENVDVAKCLVQHGANVQVKRANGRTLLHLLSSTAMLDFLLQKQDQAPRGLPLDVHDKRSDNGCTALHQACWVGNINLVIGLVAAGANPNARNSITGQTPLHYACHQGHLATVQWLVRHGGGNVYARAQHGNGALHVACWNKQTQVALWLMDNNDECHMLPSLCNDKGHDALHYACKQSVNNPRGDATDLVRQLLKRDANLGRGDAYSVSTALHFAAEWSPELCRLLVKDYDFDLMAKSVLGSVPLCHATSVGTVETMQCLMDLMKEQGHDLNVGDVRGLTALHEAILGGSLEKACTLLNHGLDVNAVSQHGETPLHVASLTAGNVDTRPGESGAAGKTRGNDRDDDEMIRQTKILELVVERGAYALCLDQDNMYPFMYAAKKRNVNKTFLILRAAASQGFFGDKSVDTLAQKNSRKRKTKEERYPNVRKRARLRNSS